MGLVAVYSLARKIRYKLIVVDSILACYRDVHRMFLKPFDVFRVLQDILTDIMNKIG